MSTDVAVLNPADSPSDHADDPPLPVLSYGGTDVIEILSIDQTASALVATIADPEISESTLAPLCATDACPTEKCETEASTAENVNEGETEGKAETEGSGPCLTENGKGEADTVESNGKGEAEALVEEKTEAEASPETEADTVESNGKGETEALV
jgi:hypothetical protein